jgi:PAS domain S-box-containing protein
MTKIFWFKFQTAFLILIPSAGLCFALEYAGLGKWLTRRTLALLTIIALAFAALISTDGMHHLVWTRLRVPSHFYTAIGPVYWAGIGYAWFLSLLQLMVFAWLFARSPRHRGIAAALIVAILCIRGSVFLDYANRNPFAPLNPIVVALNFGLLPYALAIIRFRMLDVTPVARDTIIDRMADGMIAVDVENRIADTNETAQALLGIIRPQALGQRIAKALSAYPDLLNRIGDSETAQGEVSLGSAHPRWYQFSVSPLIDRRGYRLGRLIWLHDITEQKQAQAQILDQQRTMAMLKEREILARELHDGIGQLLAAAHLEINSASALLAKGDTAQADSYLRHLAKVTQEAKESVREYLLGVKSRPTGEEGFVAGLRQYLSHYSHNYGIHVELSAPPELEEERIDSAVAAQLQPIIQEALINVRRHSGATSARVVFSLTEGDIRVMIQDDGRGFKSEDIGEKEGFGLRSMRGRAEMVGARLEVNSAPGKGTQVIIYAPRHEGEK